MEKLFKKFVKELLGTAYYSFYKRFSKINGSRILIYHAFGSKLKHDSYGISISIAKFKEHIKYLKENYKIHDITKSFSDNSDGVSITIDDGYKDTLSAIDILNDEKLPFTLFITTDYINKNQYLSEKDILEIARLNNAKIGSHGTTHQRLATLNSDQQKYELENSKKILEEITGIQIDGISYPHGSFNQQTIISNKSANYKWAATSKSGVNNKSTNKFMLHRNEIIATDSFKDIKKKLQGFYDYY